MTMETLRTTSIILKPIVPNISNNLLNKLNIPNNDRNWSNIITRTWSDDKFKAHPLSDEKMVLFRRIIIDEETKRKKTNKI